MLCFDYKLFDNEAQLLLSFTVEPFPYYNQWQEHNHNICERFNHVINCRVEIVVQPTVRCQHRQMIRWLERKRWSWCLSTHPCGVQWRSATIFVWGATYGCDYNYYRWLSKQDMTFWCEVNTCESRTHFGGTLLQVSLEGGTFGWDINSFEFWRWDIWVGH